MLRLLIEAGPNGVPAGEIAERLGQPASTTSFHLAALERAGLTQSTRQSRQIVHAVRIVALRELIAFLSETCCGGRPELCGDIARLTPLASKEDAPMVPAFNVLFLCTRNSARSIMAEAILQKVGGGRFNAYSAGSDPAPEPMPEVVARLHALGHDVSRLQAKSWDEFMGPNAPRLDFVLVCHRNRRPAVHETCGIVFRPLAERLAVLWCERARVLVEPGAPEAPPIAPWAARLGSALFRL